MKVGIRELTLHAYLGFWPEERAKPQKVIINISFEADFTAAIESDDVAQSVDYSKLAERVTTLVQSRKFNLIETLTAHILDSVMEEPRIIFADVEVQKPEAPLPNTKGSVCRAERRRT